MRHRHTVFSILLILVLLLTVAGCKKKQAALEPEPPPPAATPAQPPPPMEQVEVEPDYPEAFAEPELTVDELIASWNSTGVLQTIYFAYDSQEISETGRRQLRGNAEWLKAHTDVNTVIQGHCDERGTIEYNLALGERRADSIRSYLTNLGIDRSRIRIITYGEERPAAPGHSESAWSQNRRAAFVLER